MSISETESTIIQNRLTKEVKGKSVSKINSVISEYTLKYQDDLDWGIRNYVCSTLDTIPFVLLQVYLDEVCEDKIILIGKIIDRSNDNVSIPRFIVVAWVKILEDILRFNVYLPSNISPKIYPFLVKYQDFFDIKTLLKEWPGLIPKQQEE